MSLHLSVSQSVSLTLIHPSIYVCVRARVCVCVPHKMRSQSSSLQIGSHYGHIKIVERTGKIGTCKMRQGPKIHMHHPVPAHISTPSRETGSGTASVRTILTTHTYGSQTVRLSAIDKRSEYLHLSTRPCVCVCVCIVYLSRPTGSDG
mmetsp:Transcript_50099/g.125634  ORF Transcript_50099/g.125634 Transcript_50099/m.125634 type:complete len:148 (-) Transcript_50099:1201-1644(-)